VHGANQRFDYNSSGNTHLLAAEDSIAHAFYLSQIGRHLDKFGGMHANPTVA